MSDPISANDRDRDGEKQEEETDESEDKDSENARTRINFSIGALSLEVENHDPAEAEDLFERVWSRRLDEFEEMTDAMRERMHNYQ